MSKKRVALLCARQLMCDSLMHTLGSTDGIEILGPWAIDDHACSRIASGTPDIILIAEPVQHSARGDRVIARILVQFPSLPMIRVTLEQNVIRLYSPQTMPASSMDLINLILQLEKSDQQ